ncbi:hypothetical protein ZYGR_0U00820 [Zygosaccharomyces rouxii]|nr:hypothetical protein LQ764DRAFT_131355 [Zygosaccharomyces rouxii]GAV50226.1 hypothetical protein ZYGR_0U00820 [Zygosaccharomyces rouxii]
MEPVYQISSDSIWRASSKIATKEVCSNIEKKNYKMMLMNNRNYAGNMSVHSSSTGPSSVFSNDEGTYEQKVREIEEYYVRTLLNEDEVEQESTDAVVDQEWNRSETSSVTSSPTKLPFAFESRNVSEKALFDTSNRSSVSAEPLEFNGNVTASGTPIKKELEVKINSEYAPKSDLLPLTTENLERLSITSEKLPCKPAVHIKKTTSSVNNNNGNGNDGNLQDTNRGLYKTELCESFTTKGTCRYGNKCQFAHGLSELKFRQFGNNFRTKPCINWTKLGYCPYGKRCCFKHGSDQDIKVYLKAGTYLSNSEKEEKKNLHANVKALQKITW